MKQWVIAGALAGFVALAGTAQAQKPSAQEPTRTPKQQPTTTEAADVTDTAMTLGTVRIPREVKADGKPLPAGTYTVRLTAEPAQPDVAGTSGKLERWVEFVQKGSVKGREVVSIVPQNETKMVQKDTPPRPGTSKVEMLKSGDYLRIWINKGGNYYLVHLPV